MATLTINNDSCSIPSPTQNCFGYLYNWYAVDEVRFLANTDWHIPSDDEIKTMEIFLGMSPAEANNSNYRGTDEGGQLKETGLTYWDSPNTGATNTALFNFRGGGRRRGTSPGTFGNLKQQGYLWTSTGTILVTPDYATEREFSKDEARINRQVWIHRNTGQSVRLLRDSTTLSDGESYYYEGNDGKIYRTICIGTQEWLADNLFETQYRNGDPITNTTSDAAWIALFATESPSYCIYNDVSVECDNV